MRSLPLFGKSRCAYICAVIVLTGCGHEHQASLAECLNGAGFLVSATHSGLGGTTPDGVALTVRRLATPAAAQRLESRTAAAIGSLVVDWSGDPGGAKPRRSDLAAIRSCAS